ncbi:MAG: DUF1223 domain-containing protein [Granulosicoccus sp.]|nr:DUF1223 domain-containing protein [Granulosicoccus sp.]
MKTLTAVALILSLAIISPVQAGSVKLIELFTSHGCSSCPPADLLLGELLEQDEQLLALEFHVDYWNDLIHGSDGNFVDPYSNVAYTQRQRAYHASSLQGHPGVYTPQAVINGQVATVGSDRRSIEQALAQGTDPVLKITFETTETTDALRVVINGDRDQLLKLDNAEVVLARFLDEATTTITGGENRHRTLVNHHIVTQLESLGRVSAERDMRFDIEVPLPNHGCVVLVQAAALSPVHAAAECP